MDDLGQDLRDISNWVGPVDAPDPDTLTVMPVTAIGRPVWQRGIAAAAAVMLVVVGVWALTRNHGDRTPSDLAVADHWEPVVGSPLSARNDAKGVWTGREVIVFGGTTQPDCPLCDYAAYGDTLRDGARYFPETKTWISIAPLPEDASYVGTAIAYGGDVYYYTLSHPDVLSTTQTWMLLRYSTERDAWDTIELPDGAPSPAAITPSPWGLVLYNQGSPLVDASDFLLRLDGSWATLPTDPLASTYWRGMLQVGGSLVLFTNDPPQADDPSQPPVLEAAVLDSDTGTWTRLPDGDQIVAPVWADGELAFAPFGGGADGGEVNGWGRTVPNGGILDMSNGRWHRLPEPTPVVVAGVVGITGAYFQGLEGSVLDVASQRWVTLPAHPMGQQWGPTVVAMGRDLFTFGGNHDGTLHANAYVWHSSATTTPDTAPATDTATTVEPLTPTTLGIAGVDVQPANGCGAIGFDALNADHTQHVAVYVRLTADTLSAPVDETLTVGDERTRATFTTGINLDEFSGCNDAISSGRVDTETAAVSGTLHVSADLKDGATTWDCGNVQADLTITGMVLADGRAVPDMTIHSDYVNCFGG